jgi:hypothetical protein
MGVIGPSFPSFNCISSFVFLSIPFWCYGVHFLSILVNLRERLLYPLSFTKSGPLFHYPFFMLCSFFPFITITLVIKNI